MATYDWLLSNSGWPSWHLLHPLLVACAHRKLIPL